MSRRNRQLLRLGMAARASDVAGGRQRRHRSPGRLLPSLAGRPDADPGPVDAEALSRELVRLAELARRGFS